MAIFFIIYSLFYKFKGLKSISKKTFLLEAYISSISFKAFFNPASNRYLIVIEKRYIFLSLKLSAVEGPNKIVLSYTFLFKY